MVNTQVIQVHALLVPNYLFVEVGAGALSIVVLCAPEDILCVGINLSV